MHESLPKQERLERAKKDLTEIFEEVLLWLDDAREDTCCEQLFDYSLPSAELAAILGFCNPPFEHVAPSKFGFDCQLGNWQANTRFQAIRVNAPVGMSQINFRFAESPVESLVRVASPRFYGDMRSLVMRWVRALSRLDIREVKLPECVFAMYDESAEALIFQEQYERELRGDTRSFLQDFLTKSFEGVRLAKLHNLSPEQTTLLMRAMGRSWADDIERRELTATAGLLADEDGAPRTPTETGIEPKEIILGYKDIFAALGIKHRDQQDYKVACRSFKRKCEADGAPVKFRNKKPPIVEKGPLLGWWNSQLLAREARDQVAIDREATLSEGYQHGRVGTEVKPNIAGYVRKRAN